MLIHLKIYTMNWYLAKLVYRITCGTGQHIAQFEEQVRVIRAEDELHAFHKARLIGEAEGMNVLNSSAAVPGWKFIDISELLPLVPPSDGAEIYGVVTEQPDAEMYIRTTQKKANQLLQQGIQEFKQLNYSSIGN